MSLDFQTAALHHSVGEAQMYFSLLGIATRLDCLLSDAHWILALSLNNSTLIVLEELCLINVNICNSMILWIQYL